MLEDDRRPARPAASHAAAPAPSARDCRTPSIDSRTLLNGARELCIEHGGEEYRLRRTSQNKLILTK